MTTAEVSDRRDQPDRSERPDRQGKHLIPILRLVCDVGEGAPSAEDKLQLIKGLPARHQAQVVETLVRNLSDVARTVNDLNAINKELHATVGKLTEHPWHVATFKSWVDIGERQFARVFCAGEDRLVGLAPDVEAASLGAGSTVFLSAERNAVLSCAPQRPDASGQVGKVCDVLGKRGVIVREHDQEITLQRAHWLDEEDIKRGDQIVWCPRTNLVLELLESSEVPGVEQLSREVSQAPPRFAGYEAVRDQVIAGFSCVMAQPETAAAYGLAPAEGALLLYGPPGCGKTLLARNLAHELGVKFFVINAAAIYSPWVGESEQHLSEAFRKAREAAPALLFLDEIDAIGRVRGGVGQQHSDRVASLLLTQMEGAAGTPGIGIVGACNRVDLLDPALRSRFGKQFLLPPPRRAAVREIAATHLSPGLPYRSEDTRARCIDSLVHRLTSPNADNAVATLRFRDGTTRAVSARDLLSGRSVKHMVESACEAAFRREVSEGIAGVQVADVELAAEAAILRWRDMLRPRNVRDYLHDLPDDMDVVAVDAVVDAARPGRYLQAGG
jgi:ATP-dependent 26S proteasome regulatory subunit